MIENTNEKYNPMESMNMTKLIMKFALPCVIAMIVSSLYNIVDQIFIGRCTGYIGNAATNVGFPLIMAAQGIGLLFGDGAAAIYSIKLGENKKDESSKIIGTIISVLIIFSVIYLIISPFVLERSMWYFGATKTTISYVLDYMKIVNLSIPMTIFSCGLSPIIRADGSPQYSMSALVIGVIVNCVLDAVFMFSFKMGIKGAAYATLIGEIITTILCIRYIFRFKNISLKISDLKIEMHLLCKVMLYGLPTLIIQLAVTLIIIVSNNMLTEYGALSVYGSDIPLASMGIVMKVNDLLLGIIIGIGAGGQPILGYNMGSHNIKRVKEAYFSLIKIASFVAAAGFIMFQFCPQYIINLFGRDNGSLYNEFALKSFKIFLMLCAFIGFELISITFLQSIGRPLKSIILSLCKQTFYLIPLMIVLPKFYGVDGVLYAGPCAEALSVVTAVILIRKQFKEFDAEDKTFDKEEKSVLVRE